MFSLNETVFYPGHGLARIVELTEKNVAGSIVGLYKLSFIHKDMTVLLPKHSMQNLGVRYVACEAVIEDALAELRRPSKLKLKNAFDFVPSGWSRRQKDYQLKIQGGVLVDMAAVYRDIMIISATKELSFGEKNILNLVEDLLAQEISYARNIARDSVCEILKKPFREGAFFAGGAVDIVQDGGLNGANNLVGIN